eukprot:4463417-Pleurochrysis_carterae.AAC.3
MHARHQPECPCLRACAIRARSLPSAESATRGHPVRCEAFSKSSPSRRHLACTDAVFPACHRAHTVIAILLLRLAMH